MSPSETSTGNGAASATEPPHQEIRSLGDYGRQIHHDAEELAAAVQEATTGVQRRLREQVEQRPYSCLGVAAGIGYVLGGGLSSPLTAMLLTAATRLAMALAARELGARLLPGGSASVQHRSS
jgi:ElaB/YqjD/DUF883 family membrane-anchored ribosome-binding protein